MRNLATGSKTKSPNGLLAYHLLRAFGRDGDLVREASRSSSGKPEAARSSGSAPTPPVRPIVDLNDGIRRLSTLLSAVSGAGNDLRIDLCADPVPLHCAPEQLDLALIEAVAHMRSLLSGSGTIALRTKRVHHHAFLALIACEDGTETFRFGALRVPPRAGPASLFGALRRLAIGAHGKLRFQAPATMILKLPTVLKLADGKRPDIPMPARRDTR